MRIGQVAALAGVPTATVRYYERRGLIAQTTRTASGYRFFGHDAARRLRKDGYRTAVVTNNVREFSHGWRGLVPVEELFDVAVDSSDCGLRKPNPAVFHHTLELLGGVAPNRAVFLDDSPGNVDGARRAGLHAIHVEDPDAALAALDALLQR